jgi:hypothetical protein
MASTDTQNQAGFFSKLAADNTDSASQQTATISEPLRAIAKKYNVRNISSTELNIMSSELYNDEIISREEFAMLSFQPEMSNNYEAVGAQGIQRPDPGRSRDALAEWERILQTQEQFGSSDYFTDRTRMVVQLLRRLDEIHSNA